MASRAQQVHQKMPTSSNEHPDVWANSAQDLGRVHSCRPCHLYAAIRRCCHSKGPFRDWTDTLYRCVLAGASDKSMVERIECYCCWPPRIVDTHTNTTRSALGVVALLGQLVFDMADGYWQK